jgi:hypothetical protein
MDLKNQAAREKPKRYGLFLGNKSTRVPDPKKVLEIKFEAALKELESISREQKLLELKKMKKR